MARLAYLDREDLPELERDIFDDLLKQRGSIGNIFRIVAHSPCRTCSCVECCTSAMGCGIGPRSILACENSLL